MSKLQLVGLDDDGEHVVLESPNGQRFTLPIDDSLRAAVRRDRPHFEQAKAQASGAMSPREMQARMRSGQTAVQVAEAAGVPVEIIERYEGPVLAEREWVAQQARETRIGHDTGAPILGDLVTDRLATRGVSTDSSVWQASREAAGPWTVELTFTVGDTDLTAQWLFDPQGRTLHALDDEARWLSETDLADEPVRRHLNAVHSADTQTDIALAVRPVLAAVDSPDEPEDEQVSTEALLDDLNDLRGVRQPLDDEDDDDFEGFGPQHVFDFDQPSLVDPPAAHPPTSLPQSALDATVLELPSGLRDTTPHATDPVHDDEPSLPAPDDDEPHPKPASSSRGRSRSRRSRASVPSWDEIVFGAKPE